MTARTIAVLPARYGSMRFPGKPLAPILGRPMIQWTYESVSRCPDLDDVLVATDDQRIHDAVSAFGGKAVMTSPNHQTGTDRIAEAIQADPADLVVNAQGDEPLVDAGVISRLIAMMRSSGAEMGTVAVPFGKTGRDPQDPNAVKVVVDRNGMALYFSRSLIPYPRAGGVAVEPLLHWGLYAYRRDFLETFVKWPVGRLENCEKLEQLRALENGARICVLVTEVQPSGVDQPSDIAHVEELIRARGNA